MSNKLEEKETRDRKKGLCYFCNEPAVSGRVLCQRHWELKRQRSQAYRERNREAIKERYQRNKHRYAQHAKEKRWLRKSRGLCVRCKRPAIPGRVRCLVHSERSKRKCAEYKTRHRNELKERQRRQRTGRRLAGLCIDCGRAAVANETLCDEHRTHSQR